MSVSTLRPVVDADERAPPSDTESEQALLGAMLINNAAYNRVAEALLPGHFANAVHGRIYAAIGKLIDHGETANAVSLKHLFEHDSALAEIGGANYLSLLVDAAVTIINAEHYARRIIEFAQRRQFILAAQEAIAEAYQVDLERPIGDTIESFDRAMLGIAEASTQRGPRPVSFAIDEALASAERVYQFRGRPTGITTGLVDLDRKLGGLQKSDLIIVAARPSMGKTTLALTMGRAAAGAGNSVLFSTLEMSSKELGQRLLAGETGISAEQQRAGLLSRDDVQRLVDAGVLINRLPLLADDTPSSISQLRARAIRQRRRHELDLIVVDYLQLLQSDRTRIENRVQEVAQITLGLKAIAKELQVPVVALSQLNRAVERRDDKRPMLADLRDSGSIEQDADIVIFLYRAEYYLARDEPQLRANETRAQFELRFEKWSDDLAAARGLADLMIEKNRHGQIGNVKARFSPERSRFENFAWERPA